MGILTESEIKYITRSKPECLCGSINYKYYKFEGEVIILQCLDCGRFDEVNIQPGLGIEHWSDGTKIYFCPYGGSKNPYYELVDGEVNKYVDKGFLYKKLELDNSTRTTGIIPQHLIIKHYNNKIKYLDNQIKKFKKAKLKVLLK